MAAVRAHLTYANVMATIAVFGVLGGTAWAIQKNSVGSKQLKPNSVKDSETAANSVGSPEVIDNSLTGADVNEGTLGPVPSAATAGSATSAQTADTATTAGSATSAQTADTATTAGNADRLDNLNSTDFLAAGTSAGGDLGGPFSNLQLAGSSVGTGEVANDSLTGSDIDESTLDVAGMLTGRILDVGAGGTGNSGAPSGTSTGGARTAVETALPAIAMRIGNLHAVSTGTSATGSRTVALVLGGAVTTLSCTIPASQFDCTDTDIVNASPGSATFSVGVTNTGTGLAAGDDVMFGMTVSR